ncbi:MAG: hypothetical protein LT070_07125 [Solirubrobacteraceae bacterium]|nr:hypothetical protein [Solirubrobacteraceae bacterium]
MLVNAVPLSLASVSGAQIRSGTWSAPLKANYADGDVPMIAQLAGEQYQCKVRKGLRPNSLAAMRRKLDPAEGEDLRLEVRREKYVPAQVGHEDVTTTNPSTGKCCSGGAAAVALSARHPGRQVRTGMRATSRWSKSTRPPAIARLIAAPASLRPSDRRHHRVLRRVSDDAGAGSSPSRSRERLQSRGAFTRRVHGRP